MTMLIEIDGQQTELDVSDCATPEEVNRRIEGAGFGQHVRAMTAEDIEQAERISAAYVAQAQRDEAATVERLAKVFLAAGCETQGDPFTREEWDSMQPCDKRAVLAGIRAVLADVRGAIEDE